MDGAFRARGAERRIEGAGTPEAAWASCAALSSAPTCDVAAMAGTHRTIHVVSPHPDDEILALGGMLARLLAHGADVSIVAVTDGGASHPGSLRWTRESLEDVRPSETNRALAALGVDAPVRRLRIPDGGVTSHVRLLVDDLVDHVTPGDLVVAPWRRDGHPDHEACGEAAAAVAGRVRASLAEYPVWAWHWASPEESSIPWHRAQRISLDEATLDKKRSAIRAFASQLEPDGDRPPILPQHVIARFTRPYELIFAD